jgi:hypothetical protein
VGERSIQHAPRKKFINTFHLSDKQSRHNHQADEIGKKMGQPLISRRVGGHMVQSTKVSEFWPDRQRDSMASGRDSKVSVCALVGMAARFRPFLPSRGRFRSIGQTRDEARGANRDLTICYLSWPGSSGSKCEYVEKTAQCVNF